MSAAAYSHSRGLFPFHGETVAPYSLVTHESVLATLVSAAALETFAAQLCFRSGTVVEIFWHDLHDQYLNAGQPYFSSNIQGTTAWIHPCICCYSQLYDHSSSGVAFSESGFGVLLRTTEQGVHKLQLKWREANTCFTRIWRENVLVVYTLHQLVGGAEPFRCSIASFLGQVTLSTLIRTVASSIPTISLNIVKGPQEFELYAIL